MFKSKNLNSLFIWLALGAFVFGILGTFVPYKLSIACVLIGALFLGGCGGAIFFKLVTRKKEVDIFICNIIEGRVVNREHIFKRKKIRAEIDDFIDCLESDFWIKYSQKQYPSIDPLLEVQNKNSNLNFKLSALSITEQIMCLMELEEYRKETEQENVCDYWIMNITEVIVKKFQSLEESAQTVLDVIDIENLPISVQEQLVLDDIISTSKFTDNPGP